MDELFDLILERLQGVSKIAFLGIGEEKLSDDGVGPYIISKLLPYNGEKFLFINAGIDPMSRIEEIIEFNPSHLILIDTCSLNKPPGTVSIIEREHFQEHVPISSHVIPIHVVVDLLLNQIPDLDVFMIGIVPKSLEGFDELKLTKINWMEPDTIERNIDHPFFEIELTPIIKKIAHELVKMIKKIILSFS